MTNKKEQYAIGIDLGTTYSCVAVLCKGNVKILTNDQGKRTTPSYVAFNDVERLIGDPAKRQTVKNPKNTIFDVKRLIGRRFDDPQVQKDMKDWPFIVKNVKGKPMVQAEYKGKLKTFTPEVLSSMILVKMKERAEAFLGTKVKDAVITVPAYFNDPQRQATIDAGAIAGLNVLRIINEPTAAALAYGLEKEVKGKRNVLIYDLGGGTFDVTILTITDGSVFDVKATSGNTHLGGQDFDKLLVNLLKKKFKDVHHKDIGNDIKAVGRLRLQSEEAKLELSSSIVSSIDIDSLFDGEDFSTKLSRQQFNNLCSNLFKSTLEPVKKALADAKVDKNSIDDIVLVGGSIRIPKVQELLRKFFVGKDINISINPDEAVAYGAAVQAAILSGDPSDSVKDILLVDVTPLSLGIETKGGLMSKVIERNTQIPYRHMKKYTNTLANMTQISIEVYEGERSLVKNNNFLGNFVLCDVPPKPLHENDIIVTFDLDANSILTVSAVETSNGAATKVTIRGGKSSLSPADINRLRCEAERYKGEDKEELERITVRNNLESFIHKEIESSYLFRMNARCNPFKIRNFCNEKLKWIESNPNAPKREYEKIKKAVNDYTGV